MATEDLCLVCTDSLDYTGFGACGHKEACSRCVARLRFVMEDTRCMLCKQDNPAVFFTRFMGDYTQGLAPQEFAKLQERSQQGELYSLQEVSGFFDDKGHFNTIKALCSFTHPLANGATFNNLAALKRRLMDSHKLHFCDLCIKGRKVFISEQVLYSKPDLERHMRTGDDAGPLAESGFKGHPLCRFCKKRFYDGDELYRHMESAHEHCFLCRKLQPHKFVYYKDYEELDGHFQSAHHPCPHPSCLERKFVVFAEEQDLRRHFATEHGNETNMSRAQRRQAMSLNIQLTYASREEEEAAGAVAAALHRPGVVIGGGHGLQRSGGRGGSRGGGGGMRHSHSEGAMQQALQASMDSSRAEQARAAAAAAGPSSVTFSADDFPTVSGQGSSGTAPLGTWLGASSSSGAGPNLTSADHFPALPSLSKQQRRRQRERERTQQTSLAARLAGASAPIRVVNRAAAPTPAEAAAAAAAAGSSSTAVRQSRSAGNLLAAAGAGAGASSGPASAAASDDDGGDEYAGFDSDTAPASSEQQQDHFPALSGGAPAAAAAPLAHPGWVPVRRSGKPPRPGQAGSSSSSRAPAAAPTSIADFPSLAATIPASSSSSKRGGSKQGAGSSRGGSSSSIAAPSPAAQTVAEAVAAAGGVSDQLKAANKALIERCKAALSDEGFRDFRERSAGFMQGALSPGAYHTHVVQLGLLQLVPQLAALCPDVDKRTALVAAHKAYLQAQQDGSSGSSSAAGGRGKGSSKGAAAKGWVPPEAAMAALAEAEEKGSWGCERCTLINAPSSRLCEVCSAPRPANKPAATAAGGGGGGSSAAAVAGAGKGKVQLGGKGAAAGAAAAAAAASSSSWSAAAGAASSSSGSSSRASSQQQQPAAPQQPAPAAAESWPGLPGGQAGSKKGAAGSSSQQAASSAAGAGSSSSGSSSQQQQQQQQQQQSGKQKKKGSKQPLSELLSAGKTHPQNAWSQQQRLSSVAAAPSGGNQAGLGQWGKQGGSKLAKSIGAFNDAWTKP